MDAGSLQGVEDRLYTVLEVGCPPMPLPGFARWAVTLGRQIYLEAIGGRRLFATLVVPDLRFVALFIALGALDAALTRAVARQLPEPGDLVSFINPSTNRVANGIYRGTEEAKVLGVVGLYHVIDLRNGRRLKVPDQYGVIKSVGERGGTMGPAATSFQGRQLPEWLSHVERCFHQSNLLQWLAATSTAVQVVGVRAHLEQEAEESLYAEGDDGLHEVQLKNLLIWPPPRPLGSPVAVVSAGIDTDLVRAPLTVFDGASAVIHNVQVGTPGAKLAIVSPTTSRSETALVELQSRLQFYDPVPGWAPGSGPLPSQVEWSCHDA